MPVFASPIRSGKPSAMPRWLFRLLKKTGQLQNLPSKHIIQIKHRVCVACRISQPVRKWHVRARECTYERVLSWIAPMLRFSSRISAHVKNAVRLSFSYLMEVGSNAPVHQINVSVCQVIEERQRINSVFRLRMHPIFGKERSRFRQGGESFAIGRIKTDPVVYPKHL